MPSQGQRQEFLWRPNDNSPTTLTRYSLEAEHWVKAFNAAQRKHQPRTLQGELGFVAVLFQLVVSLLVFCGLLVVKLVRFNN